MYGFGFNFIPDDILLAAYKAGTFLKLVNWRGWGGEGERG